MRGKTDHHCGQEHLPKLFHSLAITLMDWSVFAHFSLQLGKLGPGPNVKLDTTVMGTIKRFSSSSDSQNSLFIFVSLIDSIWKRKEGCCAKTKPFPDHYKHAGKFSSGSACFDTRLRFTGWHHSDQQEACVRYMLKIILLTADLGPSVGECFDGDSADAWLSSFWALAHSREKDLTHKSQTFHQTHWQWHKTQPDTVRGCTRRHRELSKWGNPAAFS